MSFCLQEHVRRVAHVLWMRFSNRTQQCFVVLFWNFCGSTFRRAKLEVSDCTESPVLNIFSSKTRDIEDINISCWGSITKKFILGFTVQSRVE